MESIQGYRCKRCGHVWRPRGADPNDPNPKDPKVCPKCKSAWWDENRKVKETE